MSQNCIFCERLGNKSKEHIWPVWMHQYLPQLDGSENTSELHTFKWKEKIEKKSRSRQGHLSTKKLRVVCRDCNSGWMSELESATKPLLVKILEGSRYNLSESDQSCLARWITMKTIVGEHAEKNIYVTPLIDRKRLKDEGRVPDYYAIYIGIQHSRTEVAWQRTSQILASSPKGPNPPLNGAQRNTQTVTFVCGPLIAFSVAILEADIDASKFFSLAKLVQIHPLLHKKIEWPPKSSVSPREANHIAFALDNLKNQPNVIYAGDPPST